MSTTLINNFWPLISAIFFAVLFCVNKLSERNDRRKQKNWITGKGEIVRVFQHPKLTAYYVAFTHQNAKYYFEERRTLGDIIYKEGESVPILFNPRGNYLSTIPDRDQNLFASKVTIGNQQEAKINDNSRSSHIMDILNIGLIVLCLIAQGVILIK